MNKYRSHNCSELSEKQINTKVHLSGWLHRKRDHGNLLFIDLRDHSGITQCVIENNSKYFSTLERDGKIKPNSKLFSIVSDLEFIDEKLVELQNVYNTEVIIWNKKFLPLRNLFNLPKYELLQ